MNRLTTLLILILSIAFSTAAFADQSQITYQQAVDMAMSNSKSLKNAAADVDRTYEVRQYGSTGSLITPTEPGDPGVVRTYINSIRSDLNWQMSKKTLEVAKDSLGYAVKQAYNTVLLETEENRLANLAVENQYWQNRLAELKYQHGMISSMEKMQANSNYTGAQENQKTAVKELNDAYQKFNSLVGLPSEARPVLVAPEFVNLPNIDLEHRVSQVTSDNYTVWLGEQRTALAKLDLELYSSRTASEPYIAKQIDVAKSQNTTEDDKTKIGKAVRSLYYALKKMEDSQVLLKSKITVADQGLKITEVKFAIGMATKAEVVSARYEHAQLRQQLVALEINHDSQLMAFEKPWVSP